jgi:O-acetyl-ADP-ribose deacetylase (regulator of RNase III)
VGPVWDGGGNEEDALLASCYRECLRLAAQRGLASIAFPAISTGAYAFPKERAARIALREVRAGLLRHPGIRRVVLCCFSESDAALYQRLAGELLDR